MHLDGRRIEVAARLGLEFEVPECVLAAHQ
jgi:hypothetical protein